MPLELRPALACRDHLLAGCLSFSFMVLFAWLAAVADNHHLKATLSEMVRDWDTAEGKIFIVASLLPAIFFLLSGYPYVLPNARLDNSHPLFRQTTIILRHFCVNGGLILVGFVPTVDNTEERAQNLEAWIHGVAAAFAFSSFVISELLLLLLHAELPELELQWRLFALSLMIACSLLCICHKVLFEAHAQTDLISFSAYSKAWTFRYEMLIGGGLITQNQLIWFFSDPDPTSLKQKIFYALGVLPYAGCVGVIAFDFRYRDNEYGPEWALLEMIVLSTLMVLCLLSLKKVRVACQKKSSPIDTEDGYGTVK